MTDQSVAVLLTFHKETATQVREALRHWDWTMNEGFMVVAGRSGDTQGTEELADLNNVLARIKGFPSMFYGVWLFNDHQDIPFEWAGGQCLDTSNQTEPSTEQSGS